MLLTNCVSFSVIWQRYCMKRLGLLECNWIQVLQQPTIIRL